MRPAVRQTLYYKNSLNYTVNLTLTYCYENHASLTLSRIRWR